MIGAVGHILFPGPQQLHRRARHLLGDEDRLAHVVVDRPGPPPPEAAAQQRFIDVAFVGGQARRLGRGVERRFPVLGRAPDLAAVRRPQGRGVHGLHGRVVLERIGIGRLHLLDRPGDGRLGVADLVGDEGLLGVQALGHHGRDVGAVDLGVRSFVPFNGQGVDRRLGLPPFVGDHGDGVVADGHHLLHPGHGHDLRRIEGFQLGPEQGVLSDRRVDHAGQFQIRAVDLLAGQLVGGVETLKRLARDGPVLGVLQGDRFRHRQLGGGQGNLAVGRRAARCPMGDDPLGSGAVARRHAPGIGRRRDQHLARGGAAFAHVVVGAANAPAAAGGEAFPYLAPGQVGARRGVFGGHAGPVAVQFLGHQLGQARQGALAHFRARDADHHGLVRPHHDPGGDLVRLPGPGQGRAAARAERHAEAQDQTGGPGPRHEGAARNVHRCRHVRASPYAFRPAA